MYLPPLEEEEGDESMYNQPYVDRSALLRATLNSLAMNNVAGVLNANKHKKTIKELIDEEDENEKEEEKELISYIDKEEKEKEKEKEKNNSN